MMIIFFFLVHQVIIMHNKNKFFGKIKINNQILNRKKEKNKKNFVQILWKCQFIFFPWLMNRKTLCVLRNTFISCLFLMLFLLIKFYYSLPLNLNEDWKKKKTKLLRNFFLSVWIESENGVGNFVGRRIYGMPVFAFIVPKVIISYWIWNFFYLFFDQCTILIFLFSFFFR
jgi:hypothetical protein